jgi:DNA gyrase subunit A
MRLKGSDEIVAAGVVDEARRGGTLIVVSANGYGKKTKLAEYKTQSRGGSGLLTAKLTPKTGKLVGGRVIADEAELIAISKQSQVIRTPLREIPTLGRQTQGVRVMKLRPGDQLASLTYL